jgi:hypothetical protein
LANDLVFDVGHVVAATAAVAEPPAAAGAGLEELLHAVVNVSSAMATINAAFRIICVPPE